MLFYLQNTTFSYPESSYYAFFPYFFTRFSCKKLLISSFSLNISLPLPFISLSFILTHVVYIIRCQDRVSLLLTYNFCKSSYLSFSPHLRVDNENSHLFHKINPSVSSFLTTVWRDCFFGVMFIGKKPYLCSGFSSISVQDEEEHLLHQFTVRRALVVYAVAFCCCSPQFLYDLHRLHWGV